MYYRMIGLIGILLWSLTAVPAAGQRSEARGAPAALSLQNAEFVVKLLSPISTKTSQRGDSFSAQVLSPTQYENAVLEGKISNVKKAKRGGDKSEILFAFQALTIGNTTYPISADLRQVTNSQGVKEVDEEGRAIGRTSLKKTAASMVAGAAIGALIGALAGGGKGAAVGAGAGAAAGLLFAITLTSRGTDMEFAPGSQFALLVSDREQGQ